MRKFTKCLVVSAFIVALCVPSTAFAESEYVRLGSLPSAYSPSTSSRFDDSNQGSVEESGIAPMTAIQQARLSSSYSWSNKRTCFVPAGGSASSSYYGSTNYYWRLALTGLDGYGIINAF